MCKTLFLLCFCIALHIKQTLLYNFFGHNLEQQLKHEYVLVALQTIFLCETFYDF